MRSWKDWGLGDGNLGFNARKQTQTHTFSILKGHFVRCGQNFSLKQSKKGTNSVKKQQCRGYVEDVYVLCCSDVYPGCKINACPHLTQSKFNQCSTGVVLSSFERSQSDLFPQAVRSKCFSHWSKAVWAHWIIYLSCLHFFKMPKWASKWPVTAPLGWKTQRVHLIKSFVVQVQIL